MFKCLSMGYVIIIIIIIFNQSSWPRSCRSFLLKKKKKTQNKTSFGRGICEARSWCTWVISLQTCLVKVWVVNSWSQLLALLFYSQHVKTLSLLWAYLNIPYTIYFSTIKGLFTRQVFPFHFLKSFAYRQQCCPRSHGSMKVTKIIVLCISGQ